MNSNYVIEIAWQVDIPQNFEDLMLRAHLYKKRDDISDELYITNLLGGIE